MRTLWIPGGVEPAGTSITWRHLSGASSGGVRICRGRCGGGWKKTCLPWFMDVLGLDIPSGLVFSMVASGYLAGYLLGWSGLSLVQAGGEFSEMIICQLTCSHGCDHKSICGMV